ncbi:probable isoaspartyl peptidase/L-asparaginase GA20639 [Teleopsis dalmanni]|uniref:probable isoaspartyl peptidase/L-asparaginase GA20639 n=1 Tax=Teleopsis dalmanni TaxID=139649 RepID=UPI0018CE1916|nr:probable isoaspartyl peptidase/L-asparaginase GA20639 [Teleopsis dalmanni]XP_037938421.1 probable isoaspartyl peptidase/L-asparaginase GA20639 [Teleopsis dalmanni]
MLIRSKELCFLISKNYFRDQKNLKHISKMVNPVLIVHGGAGDISDDRVLGKLKGMKIALRLAMPQLLKEAASPSTNALDAVEAAVRALEADENFNAGFGSCLNIEGNVELEASIMEGSKLRAGCVTLLHDLLHPISVARCVMEKSGHTFLGGESAQIFAKKHGFNEVLSGTLVTPQARLALAEFKKLSKTDENLANAPTELPVVNELNTFGEPGTVGAVAIDSEGNIAAATSTGGITGKVAGRIGDTPLLGCGTYADSLYGGVSTTGYGEAIMRFNLAQRIIQKIELQGKSAQEATSEVLSDMKKRVLGGCGAITIDAKGNVGIDWNSKRMGWAYVRDGSMHYGINHGEVLTEPFI